MAKRHGGNAVSCPQHIRRCCRLLKPSSRRPERAGARPVTDPKWRRLYGWETLVVLSIFPLGSAIAATAYLLMHITTGFEYSAED